jgi:hypothetical protein
MDHKERSTQAQMATEADLPLVTFTRPCSRGFFKVEAEFKFSTIYVHGLRVEASRELKIIIPSSSGEALHIATVLHDADINKKEVKKYFGLELLQMLSIRPSVRRMQSKTLVTGICRIQRPF